VSALATRVRVSVVAIALAFGALACGDEAPVGDSKIRRSGPAASRMAVDTFRDPGEPDAGPPVPAGAFVVLDPTQQAANDQKAREDLASDVEQRIGYARAEFGDSVAVRVESGMFVVVAAERGVPFDAAADFAQRALDVYLGSFFARRPDRAVTVELVRSTAAFLDRCYRHLGDGCESDLGAYSRRSRTILVNVGPGLPTLSHELVHPLVQTDFPMIPAWFDEGIAALFEKPVFEPPGEMHGENNWRYARLARSLGSAAGRDAVHLPVLFALGDRALASDGRSLWYAEARAFCQWLDERGLLWPFYRAWRDGFEGDPTGVKSFAQMTGTTPEEADGAWIEWVKRASEARRL
jgi:hypothetical protein